MTETEWLVCIQPQFMLEFLSTSSKLSERKARLFAVACGRNIWPWMMDERSRQAVEVCEQYADGLVGQKAVNTVRRKAFAASKSPTPSFSSPGYSAATEHAAVVALNICMNTKRHDCLLMTTATADCASSLVAHLLGDTAMRKERKAQCELLRCMYGTLFRPVTIAPAILPWNDGTIPKIAQAIYDERHFEDMPILADALEEAGCDNLDILQHCRSGGPHVRGCWVLDLLLGKE